MSTFSLGLMQLDIQNERDSIKIMNELIGSCRGWANETVWNPGSHRYNGIQADSSPLASEGTQQKRLVRVLGKNPCRYTLAEKKTATTRKVCSFA